MELKSYKLVRIYTSSTDKVDHKPLYEAAVFLAKEMGLLGATVLKGIMGFGGSSSTILSANMWEVTEKLPVVVELIDEVAKIEEYLEAVQPLLEKSGKGSCVIAIPVELIYQRINAK